MSAVGTTPELLVNGPRLSADLSRLSEFGRNAAGGIDRTSFSTADTAARKWLTERCEGSGLVVDVDGIGNLFISSPTLEVGIAHLAPVLTGSHIDAVPNGGKFDGALGALAAIECVRRLHEEGAKLARPVRAVVYVDEEGNYAHLFGSSALVRGFSIAELNALIGQSGDRFTDTFEAAGGNVEAATKVRWGSEAAHATIELHIEQGPILEQRTVQIGVVTGIVSIGGGTVRFTGRADHAGTTPMGSRKDAVVAAADFITRLPSLAASVGSTAVVTTGIVRVEPGGANVIAEIAEVVVDYRDPSIENARLLEREICKAALGAASHHDVEVSFEWEEIIPGVQMHDLVRTAIKQTVLALAFSSMDIESGAGHDSQNLAALAPTGMIFVPSTGGRSHSPAEHTSWEDIERGANTLLGAVLRLAGGTQHVPHGLMAGKDTVG